MNLKNKLVLMNLILILILSIYLLRLSVLEGRVEISCKNNITKEDYCECQEKENDFPKIDLDIENLLNSYEKTP